MANRGWYLERHSTVTSNINKFWVSRDIGVNLSSERGVVKAKGQCDHGFLTVIV